MFSVCEFLSIKAGGSEMVHSEKVNSYFFLDNSRININVFIYINIIIFRVHTGETNIHENYRMYMRIGYFVKIKL